MDGVISDTQNYHAKTELNILKDYWISTIHRDSQDPITIERINNNFAWVKPSEWMKQLFQNHNKEEEFNEFIPDQKDTYLEKLYPTLVIKEIPGSVELIKNIYKSWLITAICSASNKNCINMITHKLWIKEFFGWLYSVSDINPETWKSFTSKGESEIYEFIKKQHKVTWPFIMIEDGETWMNGAIKAWGKAIAILWTNSPNKFPQATSHHKDLTTITLQEIKKILL